MTTYNTYQEAKIAYPECEIVTTGPMFSGTNASLKGTFEPKDVSIKSNNDCDGIEHCIGQSSWVICNPADYCMTINDFLDKGHKFVKGDVIFNAMNNKTYKVDHQNLQIWDHRDEDDDRRFVLHADAFQEIASQEGEASRKAMADTLDNEIAELQNKPRTKVQYEEFSLDGWDIWQSLKAYQESNEKWFYKVDDLYVEIIEWFNLAEVLRAGKSVYIKFERPVKWWDDVVDYLEKNQQSGSCNYQGVLSVGADMTREQWCDFARILLEQEGE